MVCPNSNRVHCTYLHRMCKVTSATDWRWLQYTYRQRKQKLLHRAYRLRLRRRLPSRPDEGIKFYDRHFSAPIPHIVWLWVFCEKREMGWFKGEVTQFSHTLYNFEPYNSMFSSFGNEALCSNLIVLKFSSDKEFWKSWLHSTVFRFNEQSTMCCHIISVLPVTLETLLLPQ